MFASLRRVLLGGDRDSAGGEQRCGAGLPLASPHRHWHTRHQDGALLFKGKLEDLIWLSDLGEWLIKGQVCNNCRFGEETVTSGGQSLERSALAR